MDKILHVVCMKSNADVSPGTIQECSKCKTPIWLTDVTVNMHAGRKVKLYCIDCAKTETGSISDDIPKDTIEEVERLYKQFNSPQGSQDPRVRLKALLTLAANVAVSSGCPRNIFIGIASDHYLESAKAHESARSNS